MPPRATAPDCAACSRCSSRKALKYLEKNIPDLQKMAVAYMPLGTLEELREQIIDVALERAFLLEPLPANEADFKRRLDEGVAAA